MIEANAVWETKVKGEPQLGKRGLYPNVSVANGAKVVRTMMNVIAYSDGTRDLINLADTIGADALECSDIAEKLVEHDLLGLVN